MENKKIYLYVPFDDKEEVKKCGGRFDFTKKLWYITPKNPKRKKLISKYSEPIQKYEIDLKDRIYLITEFKDLPELKKLGCLFDPEEKLWYCDLKNEKAIDKFGDKE